MKTFSYRLYPNKRQRTRLEAILEVCRSFYNFCLEERKTAYETEKRTISQFEQAGRVKILKKENAAASSVHSHILQVVVADLQKAFDAFFRRVKAGETPGYPRFKAFGRFRSFGLKEYSNGFRLDGRKLKLSGVGRVSVRWHRKLEGTIKTVRIVRKAGKWYAAFACEVEKTAISPCPTSEVGIDVGLNSLLALSNGEHVENPRWYRQSQRKLRRLHRRIARRKLGGSNRRKVVTMLAGFAERVANQRKDFLNKLAHNLVSRFSHIALEDLAVTKMARGRFAKSILDAGWAYLKQRLLCKAANAGQTVVLVNPAYTSQDCCQCGQRQKLGLKDRWYTCGCGNSRHRDENAAINIRQAGRACWASSLSKEGLAQEAAGL